ncbi:SecY-interacting protein [Paraglaciecola hydrolytica]|uniref:Protein Syd n=1 Tax=Paraglaciecola hydrolytica TaxID=1799789 RepID=A0A135ZYW0_9ALTE|nr:SecY-interacting protein [Paraglaciecola hydrolytica]KXI28169.1 protein syd [Paraglaciecola hydrolytica]
MAQAVIDAMNGFIDKFLQTSRSINSALQIEYDPAWPSLCYIPQGSLGEAGGLVSWQPVKQHKPLIWHDFEKALDLQLHPSISTYYQCYWSEHLSAQHASGKLELIQLWNEADFERLQQNLIGHILMKRRLKQTETIFFALTEEEDFILSVKNMSGEVVLEQIGLEPKQVIAPDIASFLSSIEPVIAS